ncbi:MAG: hypothetical protein GTO14_11735 [Anaerolineales bacterium]|nr:hypothetical protein [Anaerolineales bacterium]
MDCPKCGSDMSIVQYGSIEVHRCNGCSGIWFDMLEKESLKALEGSEVIDTGDSEIGKEYDPVDRIECPVCDTQMIRMVDREQWHIWFESCPTCYGAFFDAGEFKDYKQKTITDFFRSLLAKERK